jgi:eukaryotic-like serine/threonine-protein kinase
MKCSNCEWEFPIGNESNICPRCSFTRALEIGLAAETVNNLTAYEILYELGKGSMGSVWLAREKSLDRLVAIKIINTQGSEHLKKRLLREAQAEAKLNHPNIVKVHAVSSGNPSYLVMDFVPGGNLADKIGLRPLDIDFAVNLLIQVSDAIEHAHEVGIIHRDIKPSNILIDLDNKPIVADFGIAAAINETSDITQDGHLTGTPAYIAPERLTGTQEATVTSDIYSLGGLLYFCITGRPILTGSDNHSLKLILENDPPRPLLINTKIKRDLDSICMKCLEKKPTLRYQSAAELRDDLKRYLNGIPTLARPIGLFGKINRWSSRNPWKATSVGLIIMIIIGLAIVGPIVAYHMTKSRNEAIQATNSLKATLDFISKDILAKASPDNQPNKDIKLREVIDEAAKNININFKDQPLVEASIRETLGDIYQHLGETKFAEFNFEKALRLRNSIKGPLDEELHLMAELAYLYYQEGRQKESQNLSLEIIKKGKNTLGLSNINVIYGYLIYQSTLFSYGKSTEAYKILEEIKPAIEKYFPGENPIRLLYLNNYAGVYSALGKFNKAIEIGEELVKVRRKVSGNNHSDTLLALENLAYYYIIIENYDLAEKNMKEARDQRIKLMGPISRLTMLDDCIMAEIYRHQKKYEYAELIATELVKKSSLNYGTENKDTIRFKITLANIYLSENKNSEVVNLINDTLSILSSHEIPEWPQWRTAYAESILGSALLNLNKLNEAEKHLEHGYELFKSYAKSLSWINTNEYNDTKKHLLKYYRAINDNIKFNKLKND